VGFHEWLRHEEERYSLTVTWGSGRAVYDRAMGPLNGITVVEFVAIGPVPFCGRLLADLGADVIVVERASPADDGVRIREMSGRSRRSIGIELKHPEGHDVARRLVSQADVLIEGFRPGVMERLGLGPDVVEELNPQLVYGRMTGWGQDGPMASLAGHDINYISMVGALDSMGTPDQPLVPLNLVADYGGGALYLAFGVLAALVERQQSGRGQVVDAAMVDGAASLMEPYFTLSAIGMHTGRRGTNLLDGGAPFYRTYRTADDKWVAVGALEPQFYALLIDGLGLDLAALPNQMDQARWPELAEIIGSVFATEDRDTWATRFAGTDACVTPVLSRDEAMNAEHNVARAVFTAASGIPGPAPAPRFSRSVAGDPRPTQPVGEDTNAILEWLGYDAATRDRLLAERRVR
jgi:alpha-methylacyl-CoA racemase